MTLYEFRLLDEDDQNRGKTLKPFNKSGKKGYNSISRYYFLYKYLVNWEISLTKTILKHNLEML